MHSGYSILAELDPNYFWDVDLSRMDDHASCRLIIDRVFTLGRMEEVNRVLSFYGQEKVMDILINLPYIEPKTLNFIIKRFHKPAEEFRCVQRKQSNPQYWNS